MRTQSEVTQAYKGLEGHSQEASHCHRTLLSLTRTWLLLRMWRVSQLTRTRAVLLGQLQKMAGTLRTPP